VRGAARLGVEQLLDLDGLLLGLPGLEAGNCMNPPSDWLM
jgi:hypothetical protein